MSVQNPERLATKQDLKDMYDRIRPYMGGLPEVVANKFSKGDLYSTDEKMIGQWINGKPLYQRAFSLTIPTADDKVYIAIESDIEDCIESFGYASFGDGTWMCLSNSDLNNKRSFYAQTAKSTSSSNYGKLRFFFQGTILYGQPAVIVAKYTKISDTAISIGSDTDYSTEEKIIGTWIDGKPLYQRTLKITDLSAISSTVRGWYIVYSDSVTKYDMLKVEFGSSFITVSSNGVTYISPVNEYITESSSPVMYTSIRPDVNDTTHVLNIRMLNSGESQLRATGAILYVTIQYTKTSD